MPYQCVRIYRFRPGALGRVIKSLRSDLVRAFLGQPGFLSYRLVTTADDRAISESTWETEAQAASANVVEAAWVRTSISGDLDGLPDVLIGPIEVER